MSSGDDEPEAKKIKLSLCTQDNLYEEGELIENDDEGNIDLRSNENFPIGTISNDVSHFPEADVETFNSDNVLNTSMGSFDFQVLDDLSDAEKEGDTLDHANENRDEEDDYDDDDDDEEDEINEQEIDAMLDDGMPVMPKAKCKFGKETLNTKLLLPFGDEDFLFPKVGEKTLLVERGKNPFDILPEGWVVISHLSGMPVYLHKQSRVCTLSRPYFLGPGSVRKHDIPVSAVPCLQYKRALQDGECPVSHNNMNNQEKEQYGSTQVSDLIEGMQHIDDTSSADMICVEVPPTLAETQVNGSDPCSSQLELNSTQNIPTASSETGIPPEPLLSDHQNHFSGKVKVQSAEEHRRINSLDPIAFREYCQKLFEFKTITIRRFQRWKDRRKHNTILKRAVRPTLPPTTKLITCQLQNDKGFQMKKKEFVLNPAGKSAVCILHEYAQHAMKVQPKYKFTELENSQTPYSATVIINDIHYGTGYASSKKLAKLEAARVTLDILIPEINKDENDKKKYSNPCHDLSFFDTVKIEDPGLLDLCTIAGHPSPFQILNECLQRNFGMGDTQPKMDLKTLKHQKSEFTMRVGKHEAKVICKNKREGRQQASQAILQLLHPHIKMWGSLLRLYFKANEVQEKREEEHSVTMLQTKAKPNKAILNKLRQEMTKLHLKRDTFSTTVTRKFHLNGHEIRSAELGSVEL